MRRPGFIEGALVALGLAGAAGAGFIVLGPVLGASFLIRFAIVAAAGAYLLYLLARSRERKGRVAIAVIWLVSAAAIWLLAPSFAWFVIAHAGLVWLARSLYYYEGVLPALIDLGLSALALLAALAAAKQTGSLFLAVWTFFLVQALFVVIPARLRAKPSAAPAEDDGFERAFRAADAALRRLSTQP